MINSNIQIESSFDLKLVENQDKFCIPMIWVSAGSFLMGDENSFSEKPFQYTFSKGYWLAKYPITQDQWAFFYHDNIQEGRGIGSYPVRNITRKQALDFCNKLNEIYSSCLPEKYRFTLPSEAHWEYACYMGNKNYIQDSVTNKAETVVRNLDQNGWGFAGMLGDLEEWCYDFGDPYPNKPTIDWIGKLNPGIMMGRGGKNGSVRLYRSERSPNDYIGMRLCLR